MKILSVFFLLSLTFMHSSAQNNDYIVFEELSGIDTLHEGPFKLLNNDVELSRNGKSFHIFNLYFSKHNFRAYGLDRKAFTKAYDDYKQIENDVLITLTPLTDSLEQKMTRLSTNELAGLHLFKPDNLLQNVIKNLYGAFSKNDIKPDGLSGLVRTTRYKMLIKRNGTYYRVDAPILTEYYVIDKASYLFPDGYHYGEINVASKVATKYVTGNIIDSILHHNPSGTFNSYYPRMTIEDRTYLSACVSTDSCNIYTYWSYPPKGIGRFQFIEGIGIVNGTYNAFFDKNFIIHVENDLITPDNDYNGPFVMKIKSVNDLPINEVCKKTYRTDNPSGIVKSESGY
ncbi:MAG TPA: hypothetical protein VHE59_09375 [Mucilaginibacter sp.]|nr:hypothetical protein [Mucilaginibacter sp.]